MTIVLRILRAFYYRFFCPDPVKDHIRRGLVVGKNFNMLKDVILDYSHIWHIEIGDDVTIAPRVIVLAHDASTKQKLGYTKLGKVKIGSRVFVGAGSIILPGVTIGDDVIIGAGSLVSKDIPSGVVAAGNPARVITSHDQFIQKSREEMAVHPCFGESYTLRAGVTNDMKLDMNHKMADGIGFVI